MSGIQSKAEIQAELAQWYKARKAASIGKSVSITTSAGTRSVTSHNLAEINSHIEKLERKLTGTGSGVNFALADFNNDISGS